MPNRFTSSISYADELDRAADRVGEINQADLRIILRRAALRFRNSVQVPLEPEIEAALARVAIVNDVSRGDLIRSIIKDWLITNGQVASPDTDVEEDGETGSGS